MSCCEDLSCAARLLEQFRNLSTSRCLPSVANHEIVQPILAPAAKLKVSCCVLHSGVRAGKTYRAFLENEDRNLVFANLVDQLRSGRLAEVGDAATDEGEFWVLQFGQIEGERDFSLEPGLHGVAIGRDHVDGIRAGERGYVQDRRVRCRCAAEPSCCL